MEIKTIFHEPRTVEGERVDTAKIMIEGGVTAEEIEALKEREGLEGFTEVLEHYVTLYKPPKAQALADTLADLAVKLPDELALEHPDLYPDWEALEGEIRDGVRLRYEGGLYRVKQTHTKQDHYPPGTDTAALYTRISAEEEIPAWVTGQSYAKDTQVTHGGKTWLSMVDNNTWEPGAAGVFDSIWREVIV